MSDATQDLFTDLDKARAKELECRQEVRNMEQLLAIHATALVEMYPESSLLKGIAEIVAKYKVAKDANYQAAKSVDDVFVQLDKQIQLIRRSVGVVSTELQ